MAVGVDGKGAGMCVVVYIDADALGIYANVDEYKMICTEEEYYRIQREYNSLDM